MRKISAIMNFYGAILLPSKNCPINILVRLIEFNWNSNYKHLKLYKLATSALCLPYGNIGSVLR